MPIRKNLLSIFILVSFCAGSSLVAERAFSAGKETFASHPEGSHPEGSHPEGSHPEGPGASRQYSGNVYNLNQANKAGGNPNGERWDINPKNGYFTKNTQGNLVFVRVPKVTSPTTTRNLEDPKVTSPTTTHNLEEQNLISTTKTPNL